MVYLSASLGADRRELLGEASPECRHECDEAQRHVAQRPNNRRGSRLSSKPVSERDPTPCLGTIGGRPLVELVFAALPQRDRERIPEGHRLTGPRFIPCPPAGLWVCAASPASTTLPAR